MKEIYVKMWQLARPCYEQGRLMDIDHIEWMIQEALFVCEIEHIDDTLLLPLVILHDVGYSEISEGNSFHQDTRNAHMQAGEKIGERLLQEIHYDINIEKILYYISVHDNWALGKHKLYQNDRILGVFNDLDYTWMATPQGFPAVRKIMNKSPEEMLEFLEQNEKPRNRPFATQTTKELYENYLEDRRKELNTQG